VYYWDKALLVSGTIRALGCGRHGYRGWIGVVHTLIRAGSRWLYQLVSKEAARMEERAYKKQQLIISGYQIQLSSTGNRVLYSPQLTPVYA